MADDKIRVLIVDDIAETRENIRKLLQFESGVEVVGAARSGAEGIQIAIETEPDIVLMDINLPDMDGIVATERIRSRLPATQIVILSVQGDSNYMRKAMLAGARDFLTKPPDIEELTAAIRRAGKMATEAKAKVSTAGGDQGRGAGRRLSGLPSIPYGRIITVYGPKGGVGTTTLTANLSIALHNRETPAVAIDGNLQYGDLSFFFNEQGKNNIVDLASRAGELDQEIVDEVLIKHSATGIRILAAPPRPELAETVDGGQFSEVLQFLKRHYAYVMVDAASLLTDITMTALDASDLTVLITTQDIPAIKNTRLFLDLAEGIGIPSENILLVMNKYDKRRSVTPEKVSENFKREFSVVIPSDEKLVVPAMDRGVPFMMDDKTSAVARGILTLAEKTRARISDLDELEAIQV